MSERIAFSEEREVKKTKELKLGTTKNSRFQAKVVERQQQQKAADSFEAKADELMANRQDQQVKGMDLAKKFMQAFRDKTLSSNKGVLIKEVERELREEFQHLILDMNNDQDQKYDGWGSLTGISLLVKVLFEMRDRINELEYQLSEYKKSST